MGGEFRDFFFVLRNNRLATAVLGEVETILWDLKKKIGAFLACFGVQVEDVGSVWDPILCLEAAQPMTKWELISLYTLNLIFLLIK